MKKITKATFKSFIRNNADALLINCVSSFDGMTDCVEQNPNSGFKPAERTERHQEHSCGINGAWLVGQSRDYFRKYNKDGLKGIEVYNSCGTFIVAITA